MRRHGRRGFLTAAVGVALAGCSSSDDGGDGNDGGSGDGSDGGDGGDTDGDTPTSSPTDDGTPTEEPTPSGFETLWETDLPVDDPEASMYRTASGPEFLAVAAENEVYGISTAEGVVEWEYDDRGDINAMALTDTRVFVHHDARTGPGTVYALDRANGEKDGQLSGTEDALPMLAFGDHVVVPWETQDLEDGLYAMTADGDRNGPVLEEPGADWLAGEGDHVAVGMRDPQNNRAVRGFDLAAESSPEQLWELQDLGTPPAAIIDGQAVAPNGGSFVLLDLETGDRTDVPVDDVDDFGNTGPVVAADGLAIYPDFFEGYLYAFDPAAEEIAWRFEDPDTKYTRWVDTGGALVLWSEDDYRALDTATGETLALGGETMEDTLTVEGNASGVYACASTVVASDVDFS